MDRTLESGGSVVVRVSMEPHAVAAPAYQTEHAAGMDLHAAVESDVTIGPGEVAAVPTGLRLEIPPGYEGQIRARSGLAAKHAIGVPTAPGTTAPDSLGEVTPLIVTCGRAPFGATRGERVAQLVIAPVVRATLDVVTELSVTARGDGGFGHTGR